MDIVKLFGSLVEALNKKDAGASRTLLRIGWELMNAKFVALPERPLGKGDQYLAHMMMEAMLAPLRDPDNSCIVSIFMPTELLQEVGLSPYNVEGFSCYVAASRADAPCLLEIDGKGVSDTLCSYHRTFLGAAECGLMPKPRFVVYTNLTCDANMLTFDYLARMYNVKSFMIDVPLAKTEQSIDYVSRQLRDLAHFLEKETGKRIDEDRLKERVALGKQTLQGYLEYQIERSDRHLGSDLVSPMYSALTNNLLLGSLEEAHYVSLLLDDVRNAPPKRGKHLFWMHTVPYWSDATAKALKFNDEAQIVCSDLALSAPLDFDTDDPYRGMAQRMIFNSLNGSALDRLDRGIELAKATKADGAVWFNHWGCKHTIALSQLAKMRFEEAGIPMLVLDGDGCDRSRGGEGQTATRLGAFIELLEAR